jgi:hypothetical protein
MTATCGASALPVIAGYRIDLVIATFQSGLAMGALK